MNLAEIYEISMPSSKRASEKYDIWGRFVARPLSFLITKALINTNITPIAVTAISILVSVIAFFLVAFGALTLIKIIGWFLFVLWGVLDCVDGNLARCKNMCSARGELWDATGGYAALALTLSSAGIQAYYDSRAMDICDPIVILILGFFSALFALFPRLILQKRKTLPLGSYVADELSDKSEFSLKKAAMSNLLSAMGLIQPFLLVALIGHLLDVFVICYFALNGAMMLFSLYRLLVK